MYTHILNIKTYNSPDLIDRLLTSINSYITTTPKINREIIINIINDSITGFDNSEYIKILSKYNKLGIELNLYNIRNLEIQKLLTQEYEKLSKNKKNDFESLFSPGGFKENISDPQLKFGGNISAHNIGLLIALGQMSNKQLDPKNVIITFHDDDILYKTVQYKNGQLITMIEDYFGKREKLISDGAKFLIGKYCEHSGSPVNLIYDYIKTLADIVDNKNILVWNPTIEKGEVVSSYIAGQMIDSIYINSLLRTPIIGIIDADSLRKRPLYTLVPDLGYYTVSGTEVADYPVFNFWINEFYISWINKIKRLDNPQYLQWETSIVHRRISTNVERNILEQDLFSSVLNPMAINQLEYEKFLITNQEEFTSILFDKAYSYDTVKLEQVTMLKLKQDFLAKIRNLFNEYKDKWVKNGILSEDFIITLDNYLKQYELKHSEIEPINNKTDLIRGLKMVKEVRSDIWPTICASLSNSISTQCKRIK